MAAITVAPPRKARKIPWASLFIYIALIFGAFFMLMQKIAPGLHRGATRGRGEDACNVLVRIVGGVRAWRVRIAQHELERELESDTRQRQPLSHYAEHAPRAVVCTGGSGLAGRVQPVRVDG